MPELPEVEIVARNLQKWLVGKPVLRLRVVDPEVMQNVTPSAVARAVKGRTCSCVQRRAKYLFLDFSEARVLVAHLGMTGKFTRIGSGEKPKHPRLIFEFSDSQSVCFQDTRRFGKVWWGSAEEMDHLSEVASLGPDPLVDGLRLGYLRNELSSSARPIKCVLMDQKVIGGLGNILANEILFRTRISPWARANELTGAQHTGIHRLIPRICREIIRKETSDEVIYLGESGAKNPFQVYAREGEPCPKCGTAICREVLAQRATFFCPVCQTGPRDETIKESC